jgi:hypothetical protein
VCGGAEGTLDTGATHRGSRRGTGGVIAPGGGTEPGGVPMGVPGGAPQREGLGGPGDVAVLGALATMARDREALPIHGRALEEEGCMEPESQAINGGAGGLMVAGGSRLKASLDLLHTEDGGETAGDWRAHERQGVPVTREDRLRKEADGTGADAHGRWSEAIDVCAVQAGSLKRLFGDHVGRFAVALSQQAYLSDRGLLRTFARATELQSRHHLSAQWCHDEPPWLS